MKVKELFKPVGISQSFGGTAVFLDRDNCKVENQSKKENSVLLRLKRELDGEEGHAYLRVQDQFESISSDLLNWAFVSKKITGLTLNQLDDFETSLEIEKTNGKLQLK